MLLQHVRPFWHPNSLPGFLHPGVQQLTQELEAARRQITRYEKQGTWKFLSLSAELELYRRIIPSDKGRALLDATTSNLALSVSIIGRFNHIPSTCPPDPTITAPSRPPSAVKAISKLDNRRSSLSASAVYNPGVERSIDVNLAHTFKYPKPVRCLKFSSDGKYLAIGLQHNGKTHIYDITTGKEKCVLVDPFMKGQVCIWTVDFSPDNKYVATGLDVGSGSHIYIWEIEPKRLRAIFKGHRGDVFSLAFSPDSQFLVSGSYDESVRIWRLRDGSSWELPDDALGYFAVCFSPNGQYIAAANSDKTLRIWRTRTGRLVDKWSAHTESAKSIAFTSDGKGLVSGGNDQTIKYWDVSSMAISQPASSEVSPRPKTEVFKLEGHTGAVRLVNFLHNKPLLFSGSNDCSVRIWNTDTAAWQCTLKGHEHYVTTLDSISSQAGDYLASGDLNGGVLLWKFV